ncbi:PBSX family phage terminase large subunit [Peribacillus frigoritolerans]|uniref:PBSX family phage terminase large subunit n=1 Tax=Peribacillus frigoritolerans TaxID=450367 RepID=UPI002281AC0A|nr:PBSX family phage terminase large subunit [Peribacillus frigoritolerans]MCY9007181.1 PBSX family phage terminase large subunit [Peribacillus frigoritolerans]
MTELKINPHFEDFIYDWDHYAYFLVGGYGSSKSFHTCAKIVIKLLNEKRTALIIRNTFETHRGSTYSLFEEVISKHLGLYNKFKFTKSPMEILFPNGSKIIFKGGDSTEKLKSLTNISLCWVEECSEISEAVFKELKGRLRHPTLSLHMLLSTNPVSKDNWSYRFFFKDDLIDWFRVDDEELYEKRVIKRHNTYYHHSVVTDNKFAKKDYIEGLQETKEFDPDYYRIAFEGKFGISGTRVLPQFEVMHSDEMYDAIQKIQNPTRKCGMDFGFSESYNALYRMIIDNDENILYIHWEYYTKGKTDPEIAEDIKEFAFSKELIQADAAEPKTIAFFRQNGFNMRSARKYRGSRFQYTKKVKRFKRIICSDACPNAIRELQYLTFKKDKAGTIKEDEFSTDPHSLSAIWYALSDHNHIDLKGDKMKELTKESLGIW